MSHISAEEITRKALALIDEQGSAFSMRQLGRALGVDAKAVYYYFPSKEILLNAMLELALSEMDLSGLPTMPWQEQLRTLAREYYGLAAAHPGLIPLMVRIDGSMPAVFDVIERLVAALARTPLAPEAMVQIIDLFLGFLPSFAVDRPTQDEGPDDLFLQLKSLSPTRYPATAALLARLDRDQLADDLELQIDIVLWGIEALIAREQARTG